MGLESEKESEEWDVSRKVSAVEDTTGQPPRLVFPDEWRNAHNCLTRYFSFWELWWSDVITVGDADVIANAGFDAAVYLNMLLGIAGIFGMLTFVSLVGVLPVYTTAHSPDIYGFPVSTAVNVPSSSLRVWAVIIGYVVASVLVFLFIYRFSLFYLERPVQLSRSGRTILIDGLPRNQMDQQLLEAHIRKMFPNSQLTCSIVPDFNRFHKLLKKLDIVDARLDYYNHRYPDSDPYLGCFDSIRFWSFGTSAKEILTKRRDKLNQKINKLVTQPPQSSGTAFVTFQYFKDARKFLLDAPGKDIQHHLNVVENAGGFCQAREASEIKSECSLLRCTHWKVSKAAPPSMVLWGSLSVSSQEKRVRRATYFVVLTLCLLFFTTPIAILGGMEQLLSAMGLTNVQPFDLLTSFLPSVLLLLLAVAIPEMLEKSSTLAKYNTKARQENATMVMVFIFLFLSTFLLPTFMMTTLAAMAVVFFKPDHPDVDVMSYFFPNSAMFVALVIEAGLIGSAFELLMVGDIVRRAFKVNVDSFEAPRFHYGLSYAFTLTFFSISLFYSILVPVMTPVALMFFLVRYTVDKYNLLYRCRRGPDGLLNRTFSRSVISVHFFCLFICQLGLVLYLISKSGGLTSVGLAVVLVLITIAIYLFLVLFVWGRRSGTSHWEGEDEVLVAHEEADYTHPLKTVYDQMLQQSTVN